MTDKQYAISSEESERITILKFWLMIMVLCVHSAGNSQVNFSGGSVQVFTPMWLDVLEDLFSKVISGSAVPAYFCIASILLYRKDFQWKDNIRKKIKTLLIPYFLLHTFWILLYGVFQKIPFLSVYFSSPDITIASWNLSDWINAYVGYRTGLPLVYPLWFLRNLFVLNILAIVIKKAMNRFPHVLLALSILMWLFLDHTPIFVLDVQSISFWIIGCYIVNRNIRLSTVNKIRPIYLWVIYGALIVASTVARPYGSLLFVRRICILVGVVFWFACATKIREGKWKKVLFYVSSYSFSIYLFHEMNMTALQKICVKLFPVTPFFQLAEYILIPLVILGCCLALSVLLNRFTPRVYGVITGSRQR